MFAKTDMFLLHPEPTVFGSESHCAEQADQLFRCNSIGILEQNFATFKQSPAVLLDPLAKEHVSSDWKSLAGFFGNLEEEE